MPQVNNAFLISEELIPTPAWNDIEGNPYKVLESDLGRLMHQLADCQAEVQEQRKAKVDEQQKLLLEIVEVIDAFSRIFRNVHLKEDQVNEQMRKWIKNFQTVQRKLEVILSEKGVTPIVNLDGGFDPQWHRIIETICKPGIADGTIIEEVNRGYVWNKIVLRKTEVIVVRNEDGPDYA